MDKENETKKEIIKSFKIEDTMFFKDDFNRLANDAFIFVDKGKVIASEIKQHKNFDKDLPYIFTDWQISIIKKRINKIRLTKTEREEFARKIKKKITAMQKLNVLKFFLNK